jgi:glycosyltransferase involved in cell wall biosynthesis
MLADLAAALVAGGAQVTVLAGGGKYDGATDGETGDAQGVRIVSPPIASWFARRRLLSWLAFWAWFPFWMLANGRAFDQAVLLTDPPFLPFWIGVLPRNRSPRRVIWWTMDLYPEALFASGLVRPDGWLGRVLRYLNEVGIGALNSVVCLTSQQLRALEIYHSWSDDKEAAIVPPWDLRPFERIEGADNELAAEMGWTDRRVALYAGNIGEAHDVDDLIGLARHYWGKGDDSWLFVFAVRGGRRAELERAASELHNVQVHDYFPAARTEELLSAAAVHVVSISPAWLHVLLPSKVFGALSTGRPILFLGAPEGFVQGAGAERIAAIPKGTPPERIAATLEQLGRQPTGDSEKIMAAQHASLAALTGFLMRSS